jgi:hypothetical protein
MTRYRGSQRVQAGIYFHPRQLTFRSVQQDGCLPGGSNDRYVRVPVLAMLALGPVLGLAFVIFLPFIGFAMVAWVGGAKIKEFAVAAGAAPLRILRPAWQPAMAFLTTGRFAKKPPDREAPAEVPAESEEDGWVRAIEKELEPALEDEAEELS